MKGSTSLRRFCWLQVSFSYGHCRVAHVRAANGRDGHVSRAIIDATDPKALPPEHPFWAHPPVFLTLRVTSRWRAGGAQCRASGAAAATDCAAEEHCAARAASSPGRHRARPHATVGHAARWHRTTRPGGARCQRLFALHPQRPLVHGFGQLRGQRGMQGHQPARISGVCPGGHCGGRRYRQQRQRASAVTARP